MPIEIKVLKRHHKGQSDLLCPFFVCDVCGKIISDFGNYEYKTVNSQGAWTPISPVYFTHKKCSDILRFNIPDDLKTDMWMSGNLSNFALSLHLNFIDTEEAIDSPLGIYLSAYGTRLSKFLDIDDKELNKSGVYFLFENEELVYIGQSQNIRIRLKNQHHVYKNHHKIRIAPSGGEDMNRLEKGLIALLSPEYNIIYNAY